MGHQIIKQPNNKYALFSSIVDDFVLIDATPKDIIRCWVGSYRRDMRKKVKDITEKLERGEKPYYQFTMTFEEAINRIQELHGKDAESLKMLRDAGYIPPPTEG